jgi:hypothetical protein
MTMLDSIRSTLQGHRCTHEPACPGADTTHARQAHVIAWHDEQGWYLLCNGVILFDDGGALMPNGSALAPVAA